MLCPSTLNSSVLWVLGVILMTEMPSLTAFASRAILAFESTLRLSCDGETTTVSFAAEATNENDDNKSNEANIAEKSFFIE
jgi:hypothetical protein